MLPALSFGLMTVISTATISDIAERTAARVFTLLWIISILLLFKMIPCQCLSSLPQHMFFTNIIFANNHYNCMIKNKLNNFAQGF